MVDVFRVMDELGAISFIGSSSRYCDCNNKGDGLVPLLNRRGSTKTRVNEHLLKDITLCVSSEVVFVVHGQQNKTKQCLVTCCGSNRNRLIEFTAQLSISVIRRW